MKKRYHIIIEDTHHEELKSTLALLGVKREKPNSRGTVKDLILTMFIEYEVELTKYELLFLRLACTAGKIREL